MSAITSVKEGDSRSPALWTTTINHPADKKIMARTRLNRSKIQVQLAMVALIDPHSMVLKNLPSSSSNSKILLPQDKIISVNSDKIISQSETEGMVNIPRVHQMSGETHTSKKRSSIAIQTNSLSSRMQATVNLSCVSRDPSEIITYGGIFRHSSPMKPVEVRAWRVTNSSSNPKHQMVEYISRLWSTAERWFSTSKVSLAAVRNSKAVYPCSRTRPSSSTWVVWASSTTSVCPCTRSLNQVGYQLLSHPKMLQIANDCSSHTSPTTPSLSTSTSRWSSRITNYSKTCRSMPRWPPTSRFDPSRTLQLLLLHPISSIIRRQALGSCHRNSRTHRNCHGLKVRIKSAQILAVVKSINKCTSHHLNLQTIMSTTTLAKSRRTKTI